MEPLAGRLAASCCPASLDAGDRMGIEGRGPDNPNLRLTPETIIYDEVGQIIQRNGKMIDLSNALVAVLGADLLSDQAKMATLPIESGLVCLVNSVMSAESEEDTLCFVTSVIESHELIAAGHAPTVVNPLRIQNDHRLFAIVEQDRITFDVRTVQGAFIGATACYALENGKVVHGTNEETRCFCVLELAQLAERGFDLIEAWEEARDLPQGVASIALQRVG